MFSAYCCLFLTDRTDGKVSSWQYIREPVYFSNTDFIVIFLIYIKVFCYNVREDITENIL